MMLAGLESFGEVWVCDFEFTQPDGEHPDPICMVARELRTGRMIRCWQGELRQQRVPPIPSREDVLFVAYYAVAELSCYRALGWPMPPRILDLYPEFKSLTGGLAVPCGNGLVGALAYHGLPAIDALDKKEMRDLAMRGGPFTENERHQLLDYCQSDVDALAVLLPAMLPKISLPHALIRGRYMAAVAAMEWCGTPVDVDMLSRLMAHWEDIKGRLVARIDADYGVYEGTSFNAGRFAEYLTRQGIPWPRLESGNLDLSDDTFRDMSKPHPEVAKLRELRHALSQLRLNDLAVGSDGRNRCMLSPFASRTGRNQPSNSKFIFGPSVWLRSLIHPKPGRALAYVDYEQQEFGIAAALSQDPAMRHAYATGDPYLAFAKQAGAAPPEATKKTHSVVRDRFKSCTLAVQYMMGERSLGMRLGIPEVEALELLRLHHQTYPTFWRWSQAAVDHAMLFGGLHTVFNWNVHVGGNANPRSLANFPMQANGAEILRLACSMLTERGIQVCAPVHDAVLVEGPIDRIDEVVAQTEAIMAEASQIVLGDFALRSDHKIIRNPDRYTDPRGSAMWADVLGILQELENQGVPARDIYLSRAGTPGLSYL